MTTIHQSKGREWPVVIVGSLDFHNPNVDPVGRSLAPYYLRSDAEPARRIATFDHMRQHYVAFSRAERLLVLTAGGPVHQRFGDIWDQARRWRELCQRDIAALARQRFEPRARASGAGGRAEAGAGDAPPDGRGRASGASAVRRAPRRWRGLKRACRAAVPAVELVNVTIYAGVQRLCGTLRVLAVVLWMVAIVPGLALRYRLIPDHGRHGRC